MRAVAGLALVVWVLAAVPSAGGPPTAPDAGAEAIAPVEVPTPEDRCDQYNRHEAERRRSHQGPCPYCPCACVHGELRCAPCVKCDPTRKDPDVRVSQPPAPDGLNPPRPDAGR